MNYLIGIDVGTSATKTVLFDEKGTVISSSSQEYPLYRMGRAEAGGLAGCGFKDLKRSSGSVRRGQGRCEGNRNFRPDAWPCDVG